MVKFRRVSRFVSCLLIVVMLSGCLGVGDNLHYFGDANLKYYKEVASQIDYSDVESDVPDEVTHSNKPRILGDHQKDEPWDMTLSEALHMALANNRIIRTSGSFRSGGGLLSNPDQTPSVYDMAINGSGVLFGSRSVEAALADFDATVSSSMIWGENEQVQNSFFANGVPGGTLTTDSGNFTSQFDKKFAYGGALTLSHNWNYRGFNSSSVLFPSSYTGLVQAEYRQPLLAGSGAEFTRIAGPLNANFGGITGVSQGVVIARINNDITLTRFEGAVRNLLRDTEELYWDLHLRYQIYRTATIARNSALETWRIANTINKVGGKRGFKPEDVPQALDRLYETRATAEKALSDLYSQEVALRRLLGLAVNDGRVIRPADEPTKAEFIPDWYTCLSEALIRRVELRQQKWNIKSLELQLVAAKSLTKPSLDFRSSYQVNGFGDKLLARSDKDGVTPQGLNSAYETIAQGNQKGWTLGFVFSMPLGFRSALAQVRNYELRLAKAREALAMQELEITHELAVSFQNLAALHATAKSNWNRKLAAEDRVGKIQRKFDIGVVDFDPLLRAQESLAAAEGSFHTSVVEYNKAIADLQYRKGTLLEYNNVYIAEDEWTSLARRDSLRRAWARSHALPNPFLKTEPREFVVNDRTADVLLGPTGSQTGEKRGTTRPEDSLTPEDRLSPPPAGQFEEPQTATFPQEPLR